MDVSQLSGNTSDSPHPDIIQILAADTSLRERLGLPFDQVITPQIMASAERIITDAGPSLLVELLAKLEQLQEAASRLTTKSPIETALKPLADIAFDIQSKAGLCGYGFGTSLARSICRVCEPICEGAKPLTDKVVELITTQVTALKKVFNENILGNGGAVCEAIVHELQRPLTWTSGSPTSPTPNAG